MRLALLVAALLLPLLPVRATAECTPAAPAVVAEAERAAADAERKADQADSVSVRSGNPGAARRAQITRQEAVDARKKAAGLACQAAPAAAPAAGKVGKGY
jgi:hypothetical protein